MAKFFTKKVCLILLAVVIAMGGVIWAIVANYTPKFRSGIKTVPAGNYVSGNGTASVMVDNYLYFVGDSVATADIKYGDNEYYPHGKIPDAGIFRVKIGEDSVPMLDYEYDNTYVVDEETGEKAEYQVGDAKYNTVEVAINDWDRIGKKNNGIEAVVPKIAGHDKTAIWVFGKYLIYTSPHNRYDNRGNLLSDYLDFFRVDLDGKNHTLIYTSDSADLTTEDFTVWADSTKNIYLLVHETDSDSDDPEPTIKKINVKNKKVTTLDRNVTDVVFPTATQYGKQNEALDQVYGGVMGYVYYTKDRQSINENSSLRGNVLYRCAIDDSEPEVIGDSGNAEKGTTFTPLAVTPYGVAGAQFVFSVSVSTSKATFIEKDLCVITNQNMADFKYTEPATDGDGLGLKSSYSVAVYANGFCAIDGKLYHYDIVDSRVILDKENGEAKKLMSGTIDSVLAVMGDTIYLQSGNTVYIVNKNGYSQTISVAITTTANTDETEEDTDDDTTEETTATTLPLAVLYQPMGNTGDPLIFVHDTDYIRLFYVGQPSHYLRFKSA